MKKIKEVIVVEGKTDVAFLSQFVEANYIVTNGLNVSEELLREIGSFIPNPGVVILTDPDGPGEKIRRSILERYPTIKNAYLDAKKSKKFNKVGVAQSSENEVLKALINCVTFYSGNCSVLSMNDLYEVGLFGHPHSCRIREHFVSTFHLGFSNAKTLLKKLNSLSFSRSQLDSWRSMYD